MFRQWVEKELEFEDKDNTITETSHVMNLSNEVIVAMIVYRDHISQHMWNTYINSL